MMQTVQMAISDGAYLAAHDGTRLYMYAFPSLAPVVSVVEKRSANSLPFVFRDANGQVSFENTFVYDPTSDSWNWVMDNVAAGKRKPFGRVTLVKLDSQAKGMPNQPPLPTSASVTPAAGAPVVPPSNAADS